MRVINPSRPNLPPLSAKMEETEVEEEVVGEKTEIEVDVKDVEAFSTEKSFPRTSNLRKIANL